MSGERYEEFDEHRVEEVWESLFGVRNPYRQRDLTAAELEEIHTPLFGADSRPLAHERLAEIHETARRQGVRP